MITTLVAIYGASLSTLLGAIAIYNFIREWQPLRAEKHVSFAEDNFFYSFIVANASKQSITILDCMINQYSKNPGGKLELSWGFSPYTQSSLYADPSDGPLEIPQVLKPGEVFIVGVKSEEIKKNIEFHKSSKASSQEWNPTRVMSLTVKHSLSSREHELMFKLEGNEV